MKVRRCIIPLIAIFISVVGKTQSFKQGDAVLNLFTINDSLRYFEFYIPEFPHGNVECGILKKVDSIIYSVDYIDNPDFKPFELYISADSVSKHTSSPLEKENPTSHLLFWGCLSL